MEINENMLIPEVVGKYPNTRLVFDKYGLKGCGGPLGPRETLVYFSKVHGVDLNTLLKELNEVAKEESNGKIAEGIVDAEYRESMADIIYKRFFKTGVIVVLTVGCLLGAVNLALYGILKSFTTIELIPLIHAHANAMVFGFLGIFVMGFSYQGLPRLKFVSLLMPKVADLSLKLMIIGLVLRFVSLGLYNSVLIGLISGILQLFSVILYLMVMLRTLAQSNKKENYDKYIYAGFFYLLISAIAEPTLFYFTSSAKDEKSLLYILSTFFGPLRDIQFLGFAMMMILGVNQRLFPGALSMKEIKKTTSNIIFTGLNIALILDIVSYFLIRAKYHFIGGTGLQISYLMFFIFSITFVYALGVFKRTDLIDRSIKFIKSAYVWLIIASFMMVIFPAYNYLTNQHFSHAFSGSIRHAFTVGFITMMIIGVSSKIVPMLGGNAPEKLSSLLSVFILLNFGNAIRIVTQVLTDFTYSAYPVMGISGFIEVCALGIWGYELFKNMRVSSTELKWETLSEKITSDMKVAEVIENFPETMEIFLQYGFTDLKNPVLRNTIARVATIERACKIHSVDINKFIIVLNQKIKKA